MCHLKSKIQTIHIQTNRESTHMTGAFIVGWIILALGLAIITFGDESDFYTGGENNKLYKKVSGFLRKFYRE